MIQSRHYPGNMFKVNGITFVQSNPAIFLPSLLSGRRWRGRGGSTLKGKNLFCRRKFFPSNLKERIFFYRTNSFLSE